MSSYEVIPLLNRTQSRIHGVWNDFKRFINKGSVIDLTIGIVIGNAFTDVVNSFVNDIFSPILGLIITSKLSETFLVIKKGKNYPYFTREEAKLDGAITWNYGIFCQYLINFTLISGCLFLLVRFVQKLRRTQENEVERRNSIKICPHCFTEIDERALKCPACIEYLQ